MKWRPSERIADEAARWVVLIDSADFDAAAAARFQRWIARSEAHGAAFLLASRTWDELDVLQKLKAYPAIAVLLEGGASASQKRLEQVTLGRRALLLGGAVAGVGACIVGYNLLAPGPAEAFETGIGEQRVITLADGTEVFLNAGTRLEARLGDGRRRMRIFAGEALFVVAPAEAPFVIQTGQGAIEADSGEVLVKLLPDGVRVGLMSGGARMARRGLVGHGEFVAIGAQSEIVVDDDGMAVAAAPAEQLSRRTLWRQGMLVFDNIPLAEAAADVARQTGVRFVFVDQALAQKRVGGLIRHDHLEGFLTLLRENLSIRAERRGDEIHLSAL